ncbi:ABC transporter permease [candidate division KSB1 bacterium]
MNKLIRYGQLHQLIITQFMELIRKPGVLFWGIIFPILMSLGLGIAFTKKADTIMKIAIIQEEQDSYYDSDKPKTIESFLLKNAEKVPETDYKSASYKITIEDEQLGNTTFIFNKKSWQDAMVLLKRGNLNIIMTEKDGAISYHFDPLNPSAQLTYIKLSAIFSNKKLINKPQEARIEPLTVSGTRYIDFLVPGLIAMGIMMSCMWGISYNMIDRRAKKLLRRLVATPMKKSHFLIAMMLVRIVMNLIESMLLFLFAFLVFDFRLQGSPLALMIIFLAGNIAFEGIAIFISSRTSITEIGNGLINVVVMPMMVLSGIFFSYHNFPDWSIHIIQKLPLTMLADGVRSIFIEGAGFNETAIPSLILTTIGIVFFSFGLKIFKWY